MKNILGIYSAPRPHWVGDGFPVRSLFSYNALGKHLSPFLLLDHAGPEYFAPSNQPRGVGQHPHRGFETVTIVYQGELEHKDSTGAGGKIGVGDVQWMTAASGIIHEEFHSHEFTQQGGHIEMAQLWVNLPAKDKMAKPGYQTLMNEDIKVVALKDGAGSVRVIAGDLDGTSGAAKTFTPINVWDMRLNADKTAYIDIPASHNTIVVVLKGAVLLNQSEVVRADQIALLEPGDTGISLEANNDAIVLLLSGEPIDEPIVGYGPFVMNTEQEIHQAISDFNRGRFGAMAH